MITHKHYRRYGNLRGHHTTDMRRIGSVMERSGVVTLCGWVAICSVVVTLDVGGMKDETETKGHPWPRLPS